MHPASCVDIIVSFFVCKHCVKSSDLGMNRLSAFDISAQLFCQVIEQPLAGRQILGHSIANADNGTNSSKTRLGHKISARLRCCNYRIECIGLPGRWTDRVADAGEPGSSASISRSIAPQTVRT